jgi:hypothetical protein
VVKSIFGSFGESKSMNFSLMKFLDRINGESHIEMSYIFIIILSYAEQCLDF